MFLLVAHTDLGLGEHYRSFWKPDVGNPNQRRHHGDWGHTSKLYLSSPVFQSHIYDILFLPLSVETHVSPCALVPSSVFGCSAGQPATWRFSEEPIFTLLMLLHLSFCFTGWQFGSGVNERFSTHLYYAFISQPSFNGRHGHLTVLVTF